jgi:nucleoid-associated protein YgaU
MGLFEFVKNAGSSVFGHDEPEPQAQKRDIDLAKLAQMKKQKALQNLVAKLGLEVEELRVEVDGDTATVFGQVDDQAEREKVVLAVGNVIGIAHVDDRMETKKKEPEATFHTVQKGETLGKIAQQHYGAAAKYPLIFEANKPMLTDPNKIYPGQVLRIPPLPPA